MTEKEWILMKIQNKEKFCLKGEKKLPKTPYFF